MSNVEYAYRWVRTSGGVDTDIGDATGSTYTLTASDLAHTIRVRVSFTDDDGYSETLASSATGPVVRPPNVAATGAPTIRGVVAVGKTLTANTSGITDDNGLTGVSFTYQWVKRTGGADADITGETSSSYTIKASDAGSSFKVTVAFTDDDGYSEALTSQATDIMTEAVPEPAAPKHRSVLRAEVTLLSSWHQTDPQGGQSVGDVTATETFIRAQKFHTGPGEDGYSITSVTFRVTGYGANVSERVSIYTADAAGNPATSKYVLTGDITTTDSTVTFTAPTGATLDADTDYFIVFEDTDTTTGSPSPYHVGDYMTKEETGYPGWSLGNGYEKFSTDPWTEVTTFFAAIIKGEPADSTAPTLSTATVNGTSLVLTYNELLDEVSRPGAGAYRVTVGSNTATPACDCFDQRAGGHADARDSGGQRRRSHADVHRPLVPPGAGPRGQRRGGADQPGGGQHRPGPDRQPPEPAGLQRVIRVRTAEVGRTGHRHHPHQDCPDGRKPARQYHR